MIDGYCAALLHRDSEDAGRQFWLEHACGGLRAGLMAQRFLTSAEYYQRARESVG